MTTEMFPIHIHPESMKAALAAIGFFQLGQTEKVTIEIDDDFIKIHLDDCYLTYPFDNNEGVDRDVYVQEYARSKGEAFFGTLYGYLRDRFGIGEDDDYSLNDAIDEQVNELAGFAYGCARAAIEQLSIISKEQ